MQNNYNYDFIIKNDLINKLFYKNPMQLPKIKRIIVKTTLNTTSQTHKKLLPYKIALENITGQKCINIKAKKSVANFKLKKGITLGCKNTFRKKKLKLFLHTYIYQVLPQLKEFTGIKLKHKKTNSFTCGLKNIQIFPEIQQQFNKFIKPFGMDIIFNTTSRFKKHLTILLNCYQIPTI